MVKKYCYSCWVGDWPIGFAFKREGCYNTLEERNNAVKYLKKHKFINFGSLKLFEKDIELIG